MRVIEPSATIVRHDVSPYEFIEKVGRTCYKSEDKITEGSAKKFVHNLIERNHWAMLEHETVFFETSCGFMSNFLASFDNVPEAFRFINITNYRCDNLISGSFRSFYELFKNYHDHYQILRPLERILFLNYPDIFGEFSDTVDEQLWKDTVFEIPRVMFISRYRYKPEILSHHLTHTVHFVCDRGVSHEIVRHRVASFGQESTRYCNYSKDKFGKEITVIKPLFFDEKMCAYKSWHNSCSVAEKYYFELLEYGATPQEARSVLPNSLKTEIMVTATEEEWQHIINLRYLGLTGAPHPQMKQVMAFVVDDLSTESEGRLKHETD